MTRRYDRDTLESMERYEGCDKILDTVKKFEGLSNIYYNKGLREADRGTISPAIVNLRRAVALNRKNVDAMNLLGLCYFRMGEYALAFREWIFSLDIRPYGNLASEYLGRIEKDELAMARINNAIQGYNKAVNQVAEDQEEMAVMQLKRVVARMPDMVNAQLLLALLRIQQKDYMNAAAGLKKVLVIDQENELALKYLSEIEKVKLHIRKRHVNVARESMVKTDDIIVPSKPYREYSLGRTIGDIVIGIVLGLAIMQFLVLPAIRDKQGAVGTNVVLEQSQQLDDLKRKVEELTTAKTTLEAEKQALQQKNDAYSSVIDAATETLYLAGMNKYRREDYVGAETDFKSAQTLGRKDAETFTYLILSALKQDKIQVAEGYLTEMKGALGEDAAAEAATLIENARSGRE
ncbi:MAG: hypothetical protein Q4P30_05050 [Eubacteriales bacterium]|nr:hypothetical protein [Eubacteriales bacterium]